MGLADEVAAESGPKRPGRMPCSVGVWLDGLNPEDRAAAEGVLADRVAWTHARAWQFFRDKAGLTAGHSMLSYHRRGLCRCATNR